MHHPRPFYICYTSSKDNNDKSKNEKKKKKENQKQEQLHLSESNKDILKTANEVIDLIAIGKLFQSSGALNLNERLPISVCILPGTSK